MLGTARRRCSRLLVSLLALLVAAGVVLAPAGPATAHGHRIAPTILECEAFRPLLYQGVTGQAGCVAALQRFFYYAIDAELEVDGIFGPITKNHVVWFQADRRIATDGIVGTQTWREIDEKCHEFGSRADLRNYCVSGHVRY